MSLLKEFKDFAVRGNVVDLAVAVIIGAAFGKITASLVADILMPPIGLLIGGVDFSDLVVVLKEAYISPAGDQINAVTINYGKFIQVLIDFIIIAFSIFLVVKLINNLKRKEEMATTPPPPTVNKQEILLEEIRDLLKGNSKPDH
ncbi:large-conductance mechanosensitive channel protein MscL [Pleomorphovibrio marinus]|uniref:large-conductance mechanosensitive channel protein MscL n=1 Tax=Pleomorphovibrio marinus TaxID=2164132 RepID=UPI000E0B2633|nr:large-conductance mechanosensitive channel protein MscL [Pleomorphovibrio marinus]